MRDLRSFVLSDLAELSQRNLLKRQIRELSAEARDAFVSALHCRAWPHEYPEFWKPHLESLVGAWGILVLSHDSSAGVAEALIEEAERVYLQSVCEHSLSTMAEVHLLLQIPRERPSLRRKLAALVRHSSQDIAVAAAIGLHQINPSADTALSRLRLAMFDDDHRRASIAIAELILDKTLRAEAIAAAQRLATVSHYDGVIPIARSAEHIGAEAAPLFDTFADLIQRDDRKRFVSGRGLHILARALGQMGRDPVATSTVLCTLCERPFLQGGDDALWGAVLGLEALGYIPLEAGERFLSIFDMHTCGPDVTVAAAYGLAAMKEGALPLLDQIVERFKVERWYDASALLARAIAGCGEAGLARLCDLAKYGSVEHRECAIHMIVTSAPTLTPELFSGYLDEAAEELVRALSSVHVSSKGGVELLGDILSKAKSKQTAVHAAIALCGSGRHAAYAMPALIECILDSPYEEARAWSERALREIIPTAFAAIKSALEVAAPSDRRHVLNNVAALTVEGDEQFNRLRSFPDERILEMFISTAEYLQEYGPTSLKRMAVEFTRRFDAGEVAFPPSEASLREGTKKLECYLGESCKLIDRIEGRKGDLTPAGRQLLPIVKTLVDLRRLSRGLPIRY